MRFEPKIATGKASCKKCEQKIPKGQPCVEIIYGAGMHTFKDKVCLPCLEVITADVIWIGKQQVAG